MPNGLLIAFEGIPGSTARHHLDLFSQYLHARSILHEPIHFLDTSTPLGSLTFLAHTDMFSHFNTKTTHLLMDAERWSKVETIQHYIESGFHVLVDRYLLCSVAEALSDIPNPYQSMEEFPLPDITIYFKHSAEESILSFPYSHIASLDQLARIKKCYEHAIEFYPCFKKVHVLDQDTDDKIQSRIKQIFESELVR